MIRAFADANILVSVLNKEYPSFTHTSRILSLKDKARVRIFTSPICIAIAYYLAEKKQRGTAKHKLKALCQHMEIAESSRTSVQSAFSNPAVHDLEDGLQYYAALEAGCNCIVTEDKKDFYFSKIEVLSSEDFYERYMLRKSA
jgi:predicted nucleic acid-binding protein